MYRKVYKQAQLDTLAHLETQSAKAVATTVDAKLKQAERVEARELAAASAELDALARR